MYKPLLKYLASSPHGDVPIDKDTLNLPLEGDALKTPYGIYFSSIENFITQKDFQPVLKATFSKLGREIRLNDVNEIIIRTEKHGLLYHPASIELILKKGKVKFCLNVAVSDIGRLWLKEEISILQLLHNKFNFSYLPKTYFHDEFNSMVFLIEEWFDGYNEFHISQNEERKTMLKLWKFGSGYTYLSHEQGFEIYKQAAKILTLYYDFKEFNEIYPWHHAAGDFVVKTAGEKIDVRLTTARRYEPLMDFSETDKTDPLIALFYFFLNLTVRMRLDRLDGVGETAWADDSCIEATVTGFFEALKVKESIPLDSCPAEEFLRLLKSFSKEDLETTFNPMIDLYRGSEDLPIIGTYLERHIDKLYAILQNLPS
jgi:hypothetical protein